MGQNLAYWWRETIKLFILYLGVGIAFVPSGLVYALVLHYQPFGRWSDHWLVSAVLLGLGLLAARFVWGALGNRFLSIELGKRTSPTAGEALGLLGDRDSAVAGSFERSVATFTIGTSSYFVGVRRAGRTTRAASNTELLPA